MAGGGEFAELYAEDARQSSVVLEDGRIERCDGGADRGCGIRVIHRLKTAYGYTSELSPRGLLTLASEVAELARSGGGTLRPADRPALPSPLGRPRRDPFEAPLELKVALVRRADARARDYDPRIRQVTVRYVDARRDVVCVNSYGEWAEDTRVETVLAVSAVAAGRTGDGGLATGYEAVGGTSGLELYDEHTPEAVAEAAARRTVVNLAARPAPAGRMPVVLAASAGGTMVHEALGHGLEADLVQGGMSIYDGRIGEPIASQLVTVLDDATLRGRRGSFAFDDEGTPAQRTVLVEAGVLRGYLHDRLTARKAGGAPTGNGRRESYRFRPIPRMTNTMIAPGGDDPRAILRDTDACLIERGELGEPVRGATLTGNGLEVLMSIDRVGRDLGFGVGTCGKDGQNVGVADAQPTLRIPDLVVGGRAS
jgi:TldD protein